jgi:hypothetical protein
MADTDEPQQNETAASSPASSNHPQSDPKAAKDRSCPFCGQAFTSSSLGRHLDLYIKPKNPKPADGIHDVVEIRKLRGGITRRQPKSGAKSGSVMRESSGTPSISVHASHSRESGSGLRHAEDSPAASPVQSRDKGSCGVGMNSGNWSVSGVINNLPPLAPSRKDTATPAFSQAHRIQEMRRDTMPSPRTRQPADHAADPTWRLHEQAEIGRAAEMALREVLGSVQAARRKLAPDEPIYSDVDFFALTFPGLCLAILPAPPTIFSPAPFASHDSWSLSPPGQTEFASLNRHLQTRTNEMHQLDPTIPADSTIFRHNAHIQGAFANWQLMSVKDKTASWEIQTLQAFTTAQRRADKLQVELETARQRIAHLEAEYDRLSRCQLPRELLARTPHTTSLSTAVANNLLASQAQRQTPASEADYDADALLSHWRDIVRSVARPRPAPEPRPQAQTYASSILRQNTQDHGYGGDIIANGSVFAVNGSMERTGDAFGMPVRSNTHAYIENASGKDFVSYETPPQQGAIVGSGSGVNSPQMQQAGYVYRGEVPDVDGGAEMDGHGQHERRGGGDAALDVSHVFDDSITSFSSTPVPGAGQGKVDRDALGRQSRFVQAANDGGGGSGGDDDNRARLNGNGKRGIDTLTPHGAGAANGRIDGGGKGAKEVRLYREQ